MVPTNVIHWRAAGFTDGIAASLHSQGRTPSEVLTQFLDRASAAGHWDMAAEAAGRLAALRGDTLMRGALPPDLAPLVTRWPAAWWVMEDAHGVAAALLVWSPARRAG